jgi:ferredoxin-type protein NapH
MLLVFPAILIFEIVVCRKWCRKICPLGALLSLLGGLNRFFHPRVNRSLCRYSSQKMDCAHCKSVCEENIDLHHSEKSRAMAECTKCRECADVCPAGAISFPLFSRKRE